MRENWKSNNNELRKPVARELFVAPPTPPSRRRRRRWSEAEIEYWRKRNHRRFSRM